MLRLEQHAPRRHSALMDWLEHCAIHVPAFLELDRPKLGSELCGRSQKRATKSSLRSPVDELGSALLLRCQFPTTEAQSFCTEKARLVDPWRRACLARASPLS
mmetsp:Transcript_107199/g.342043  ORF Transcript_107199/g.342043 Transcript_107199/m.342043 type:complete len:103 (-) Transcript_107199:37-345(-)